LAEFDYLGGGGHQHIVVSIFGRPKRLRKWLIDALKNTLWAATRLPTVMALHFTSSHMADPEVQKP
jgi:hypothetical protein